MFNIESRSYLAVPARLIEVPGMRALGITFAGALGKRHRDNGPTFQ